MKMTNEELVELIKKGDEGLLPQLWEQVRRFVALKARQFFNQITVDGHSYGLELDDLINHGYFGLLRAIKGFEPEMGYTFLTYLTKTLQTSFLEAAGMRSSKRDWLNYAGSLDVPAGGKDGNSPLVDLLEDLGDLVPGSSDISVLVLEDVWNQELRAALDEAMTVLEPQQRELLNMVYYFEVPMTEVAEVWGLTRQRIYQLHDVALHEIRRSKHGYKLKGFLPYHNYEIDAYYGTGFSAWKERGQSSSEFILMNSRKRGKIFDK